LFACSLVLAKNLNLLLMLNQENYITLC